MLLLPHLVGILEAACQAASRARLWPSGAATWFRAQPSWSPSKGGAGLLRVRKAFMGDLWAGVFDTMYFPKLYLPSGGT